ncbi:MAG: 50S ribosomal protein L35 [Phycisphaeraceae bacterium]|jgi:large subunit ribosomal protein L35|nr:50S ribosomal protein L35 [Phycisphaeraceae bacterium]
MPKLKGHKGLAKRVRITANGKVKFTKRGKRHRNSHMSGDTIRGLNRPGVLSRAAARTLEKKLHIRVKGAED